MRNSLSPAGRTAPTRWLPWTGLVLLSLLVAQPTMAQHSEVAKLLPSAGAEGDSFGRDVSVYGDVALIGASFSDDNGSGSGSAFVFRYDPISDQWNEEAKLLASDGTSSDEFGCSVVIHDDLALIGAQRANGMVASSGKVYVFRHDPISASWVEEAVLVASDGDGGDYFGGDVFFDGDVALIGSMSDDDNGPQSGSAYVFRHDPVSNTWSEEAKLLPTFGGAYYYFGRSVSISGDVALIGTQDDDGHGAATGSAYVFRYDPVSQSWSEEAKLVAGDAAAGDLFGISVAISDDVALIGSTGDDDLGENSGSVYFFRYDQPYETWLEESKLLASDGAPGDGFGYGLCLSGHDALIGARADDDNGDHAGATYVLYHDTNTDSWRERGKLLAGDGAAGDSFGNAVALFDDVALIGANANDDFGSNSGSAYVFDLHFPLQVDLKCNGQDDNLILFSGDNVNLTIDVQARDQAEEPVDVWVLVVCLNWGQVFSYGYWTQPSWAVGLDNVFYSGGLTDASATVLNASIPPGYYHAILLVDDVADGFLHFSDVVDYDAITFLVL